MLLSVPSGTRLSLYDTSLTVSSKTLATSQFFKEPQARLNANPLNLVCVRCNILDVVGLGGLEPPASPLSGVRSNHLSYRPNVRFLQLRLVEPVGIEPTTPCLQSRCSPS